MKKILFLLISFCLAIPLIAFPGDHNSLTCDKSFIGISAIIYDNEDQYNTDTASPPPTTRRLPRNITEADIVAYYSVVTSTDLWKKQNRANIVAAINTDLNSANSKIKQNIRANHDNTFEGHPLQVTKWGDSLSDFVSFYGVLTPGALGVGVPIPPVGGIYGGSPVWIDSWSDYFTIYGQPPLSPVYTRNYGIATYETPHVMGLMGFSSYYDGVNGWWDIEPHSSKCPKGGPGEVKVADWFLPIPTQPVHTQNGKSALHSSLMIGGNDVLHGLMQGHLIPTLGTYTVDLVVENMTFMVDWHLENGKKVLLEGTIPGYSGPIDKYDSLIVNRGALCRPLADSFIKPQDVPWWACALGPQVCYAMAKQVKEYDEKVAKAFADFARKIIKKKSSPADNFFDSLQSINLNNFGTIGDVFTNAGNVLDQAAQDNIAHIEAVVGGVAVGVGVATENPTAGVTTTAAIELALSKKKKKKEEWQGNPMLRLLSISQACINDKIAYDIGPAYKSAYPGYVEVFDLYNYFSNEWDFNFGNNFWVPKKGIYDKYNTFLQDVINVGSDDASVVDPIHIGPKGYELWGSLIGTKLKGLGWNRTDDYIDPIVNVDNDGLGRIIKKKSKEVGIFGIESTATIRIKSRKEDGLNGYGEYGGYLRRYKDGSVIYLRQLYDVPTVDSGTKFDIPHVVSGLHQIRYAEEGGPAGRLGFPISDKHCTTALACSVEDVDFECGAISDNHLDFIEHIHTNMTSNKCGLKLPISQ